jgi:hypothetical protein
MRDDFEKTGSKAAMTKKVIQYLYCVTVQHSANQTGVPQLEAAGTHT